MMNLAGMSNRDFLWEKIGVGAIKTMHIFFKMDRAGIEPAASSLRTTRSPKLSYRPDIRNYMFLNTF